MKGTPYIYQGEELGMTNAYFTHIEDYRDIESLNAFRELTENSLVDEEDMMSRLAAVSRDNARTPMQWDETANAGFTSGTPWISVNPNYLLINAKAALKDKDSIFYYYQKLIHLRKSRDIIVDGLFQSLMAEDGQIYAYQRILGAERLVVACNFTDQEAPCILFDEPGEELISNYRFHKDGLLKPYEARAVLYSRK